jgi:hypothetical protein
MRIPRLTGLSVLALAALIVVGCRSSRVRFDLLDMFFPDNRPLHEQYPDTGPQYPSNSKQHFGNNP